MPLPSSGQPRESHGRQRVHFDRGSVIEISTGSHPLTGSARARVVGVSERPIAVDQLARMRGMTRLYHEQFFADVRFTTVATLALFVLGWWEVPEAFALIPVVALVGAANTAFDASYLVFARQYAARLERVADPEGRTLVAARLEDAYLFPLDRPKVVTLRFGSDFTWFGFMTLFYTLLGIAAAGFGLALALPVLADHGSQWLGAYAAVLGAMLLATVGTGIWWFPGGAGERRLRSILDEVFGER
jgi:hypothetical protein